MRKAILLGSVAVLAGCASAPPPAAPVPVVKTLSYAVPAVPSASYAFSDTSSFDIQTGAAGDIRVNIGSAGIVDASFAAKDSAALQATIHVTKLAASMTNSQMGGGPAATEAEVQGDAVLTVTPKGVPTIVSLPKLSNLAERVGISESFFRKMFVRLPATAARPGMSWVDTVATTDDNGGTKASVRDVVTSTLAGDTSVNGRKLAHITTSSQRTLSVSGINEGVEIAQKLSGTTTGHVLWDMDRMLLVERSEVTELTGTFDLPQMNMLGLPVKAHASSRLVLR